MIIWLVIATIGIIVGTIGIIILYKSKDEYTAGLLMVILGYGIGFALFVCIITLTAEYNEFITQYNMIENYIENNINPDKIIIVNINNKLLEYQTKKQIYGVFSLYPDSILNLEFIKVP